jgi:hypothetical protein
MNSLELIPCAGLCNRLRAIFSYRLKAIEEGKQLIVYWEDHSHCFGNIFNTIIEIPPNVSIQNYLEYKSINPLGNPLKSYSQCCIPNYECIRLTKQFKEIYNDIMNKLFEGKPFISVHIRRTDFTIDALKGGHYVPDEYFYEFIDSHLKTSPELLVYVATDNPETQRIFQAKYPGTIKIIQQIPETPIRGTLRHTNSIFAFLDLCICVSGIAFHGTPISSFSETIELMRRQNVKTLW